MTFIIVGLILLLTQYDIRFVKMRKLKDSLFNLSGLFLLILMLMEIIGLVSATVGYVEIGNFIKQFSSLYIIFLTIYFTIRHKNYIKGIVGNIIIIFGSCLNTLAMNLNGGKMPVYPDISYGSGFVDIFVKGSNIYVLGDSKANFIWLTDIMDIGFSIISIGDIFIFGGLIYIVVSSLRKSA